VNPYDDQGNVLPLITTTEPAIPGTADKYFSLHTTSLITAQPITTLALAAFPQNKHVFFVCLTVFSVYFGWRCCSKVQAYNFRLCVTQQTDNMVPFTQPPDYDPSMWELARRLYQVYQSFPTRIDVSLASAVAATPPCLPSKFSSFILPLHQAISYHF
jgi:hypothetical protein